MRAHPIDDSTRIEAWCGSQHGFPPPKKESQPAGSLIGSKDTSGADVARVPFPYNGVLND
ncbi:MAG TPA: hypothetical protein VHZ51_31850 [Ktedonobacteraceae bacterium]|nr:hypothetical protein [Ktedonobacteraceae bacterium]